MAERAVTILLVEDEAIIGMSETRVLRAGGYEVVHAVSGEEAVQAALAPGAAIDLILMDIDLGPGMDGTEAARIILAAREYPVIFLSSHSEQEITARTENIPSYGYVAKGSGKAVLYASLKMAFRLWEAHRKLAAQAAELARKEAEYRTILDAVPAYIAYMDGDSRVLRANAALERALGAPPGGLEGRTVHELFPAGQARKFHADNRRVIAEGAPILGAPEPYDAGGSARAAVTDKYPFRGPGGEPEGVIMVTQDVTERLEVERALRQETELLDLFLEKSPVHVFFKDAEGRSLRLSRNYEALLGRPLPELLGKSMRDLFPPPLGESMTEDDKRVMREGKTLEIYEELGGRSYVTYKFPIAEGGEPKYLAGFTMDISPQAEARRALEASLAEKGVLLKELQHRVKNSLSMISSLLELEKGKLADPAALAVFADMQARIASIATLYELLYGSEGSDEVELSQYFTELSATVGRSFKAAERGISFDLRLEVAPLDVKRAIPLGLVVNELLTNALKYAFPGGAGGRVGLALARRDGRLEVAIEDSGPGLPPGVDPATSASMGFTIVRFLAIQIGAAFEARNKAGGGLVAALSLPAAPPGPRPDSHA